MAAFQKVQDTAWKETAHFLNRCDVNKTCGKLPNIMQNIEYPSNLSILTASGILRDKSGRKFGYLYSM